MHRAGVAMVTLLLATGWPAQADDGTVVIDMPPPVAESAEASTYQQHRNGASVGEIALARYGGARQWPVVTSVPGPPSNVRGYAWASTFPPVAGGAWARWTAGTWGAGHWSPGYWGWGWGGYPYCGIGWRYPIWGYPSWGCGPVVPVGGRPAVRRTSSSFRVQPFRGPFR